MGSYLTKPKEQSIKAPVLSFWQLSARDIDQNLIDFHQFEGKRAIILVNVASNSKYTDSNYKQLNQMMKEFKDKGLEILAFPCDQFGGEEGTNEEIKKFVKQKYNVKFLMFQKVLVNTEDLHPVYSFVRENSALYDPQTDDTKIIEDDFTIFVVNGQGKVAKYFKASEDLTPVRNLIETLVQLYAIK